MQMFLSFFAENFKLFVCYNMSVYPIYENKVAAPYSIQTYVQEKGMCLKPITLWKVVSLLGCILFVKFGTGVTEDEK